MASGIPQPSSGPSASQTLREKGNKMLGLYQSAEETEALAFLDQARDLYREAIKVAETNDDKSSALYNLCLVMRATSLILFGWKKTEVGCEAACEAIRLAEEAFQAGKAVKSESWVAKLRKASIEFAKKIATEHSEIVQNICPSFPTCFAESVFHVAADRLFKIAVVRIDVRRASNDRGLSAEKQAYADELKKNGLDMFDRRTESALEDAHCFATLAHQCLVKEEHLSSGMEKLGISLRGAGVSELIADIVAQKNLCEARRALYRASFLKSQAIEAEEDIQVGVAYLALDAFKFAVVLAESSEDIETEAFAFAEMAFLYQNMLQMEQIAKEYAKQSISLAHSLAPRNVTTSEWYKLATKILQDYQLKCNRMEQEEKTRLYEKYKTDITTVRAALETLKDQPAELLRKIYKDYSPLIGSLDESKVGKDEIRKTFQVAITHFHPDKHLGADEKTFIVSYEISEILNAIWMKKFK